MRASRTIVLVRPRNGTGVEVTTSWCVAMLNGKAYNRDTHIWLARILEVGRMDTATRHRVTIVVPDTYPAVYPTRNGGCTREIKTILS